MDELSTWAADSEDLGGVIQKGWPTVCWDACSVQRDPGLRVSGFLLGSKLLVSNYNRAVSPGWYFPS